MAVFPFEILCVIYQSPGHSINSDCLPKKDYELLQELLIIEHASAAAIFCDWFNLQLDDNGKLSVIFYSNNHKEPDEPIWLGAEDVDVELTGHERLILASDPD